MAWTTPRDWTVGEGLTAAKFDTYISDNLTGLLPVDQLEWGTWALTLTDFTLGNGTLVNRYTQLAKTVIGQVTFTLGSTSAVGTAGTFSAPVEASANYTAQVNYVGGCQLVENGANAHIGSVRLASTTTLRPLVLATSGATAVEVTLTATVPFTWGAGDVIAFTFCYEAA